MSFMIFPTAQAADMAQNVILLLGSRAVSFEGYGVDAETNVINTAFRNGVLGPIVTRQRWSPVIECAEGFAIFHPDEFVGGTFTATVRNDYPAVLAAGFGLDVALIDWAAIGIADPTVKIPLTGREWIDKAFAIVGLTYTEADEITDEVVP